MSQDREQESTPTSDKTVTNEGTPAEPCGEFAFIARNVNTAIRLADVSENQIVSLNLRNNFIRNHAFPWMIFRLRQLPMLKDLDLGENKIDDAEAILVAEGLPQLECLRVANNFIGPTGAFEIAHRLPRLRKLDIGWNRIGTNGAESIATKLINLEELHIGDNDIRDAGAIAIARNMRALKTLDVSSNQISTTGAVEIAENLKALQILKISMNGAGEQGLETQGAITIANGLPELKTLDLSGNRIADAGLKAITERLTRLEHLDISRNRISDVNTIVSLLESKATPISRDVSERAPLRHVNFVENPVRWPTNEAVDGAVLANYDPLTLLRSLQAGPDRASEFVARAVLVGDGMHGKTHLALWLTDHPERFLAIPTGQETRTRGFKPFETTVSVDLDSYGLHPKAVDVRLTIIDCGGQHEQLQSHHNLVYSGSDRTLFLLCLHGGKDFKKGNRADYYLRMLETFRHEGDSDKRVRVVAVVTHGDIARRIDLPSEEEMQRLYPRLRIRLVDHYDSTNGTNLEQVRIQIKEQLSTMSGLTDLVDSAVMRVREDIRRRFNTGGSNFQIYNNQFPLCPSIDAEEFISICQRWHLHEDVWMRTLKSLCNLGEILVPGLDKRNYRLPKDVVILNPLFVNRYINQIVTDDDIRRSKGFMKESKFAEFCGELDRFQKEELRGLLRKHLVVFDWTIRTEGGVLTKGMLVPDLLPLRDEVSREKWNDASCGATLTFKNFLGEWRVFEMMAKHETMLRPLELSEEEKGMHPSPVGVFRNECMIERGASRALIVTDVLEMKIDISVRGSNFDDAKQFLRAITSDLVPLEEHGQVEIRSMDASPRVENAVIRPACHEFFFRRTAKNAWEIAFANEAPCVLPCHRVGFVFISRLLSEPNRPISDIDLFARGDAALIEEAEQETINEILDKRGKNAILARIDRLEIDSEGYDPSRRLEARDELAALRIELNQSKGLNRRKVNLGNTKKKNAQTAVGNAINVALDTLHNAGQHKLADHLGSHIKNAGDYRRCYLHEDPPIWVVSGWTAEPEQPRPTE